jgi:polyphenol oxidase
MGDARILKWTEADALGAVVAVTTRHGGVSEGPYASLNLGLHVGDDAARVVTNRERAAAAFGATLGDTVFAQQVHGVGMAVVGPADRGRGARRMDDAVPATDILLCTTPGVTVVMLVADCVPLALVDPEARVLAVVHAGWRGTAAGAVGRAVSAIKERGARPDRTTAFIGPAVRPSAYQVDAVVVDGLTAAVAPGALRPEVALPDGDDHWLVDLVAANRQQLEWAGIEPSRIFHGGLSTDDEAFFSDRAARPCGRFALMARLTVS